MGETSKLSIRKPGKLLFISRCNLQGERRLPETRDQRSHVPQRSAGKKVYDWSNHLNHVWNLCLSQLESEVSKPFPPSCHPIVFLNSFNSGLHILHRILL